MMNGDKTIADISTTTSHGSNENHSTLSTSYSTKLYTDSAALISRQIKDDKSECRFVVAKYGIDPHELLHLLERWTQNLIDEYKQRRERFKLILKEKWDRGELHGVKWDEDKKQRSIYVHMEKLTEWKQTSQLITKRYSQESQATSNNIKETINHLIDELLEVTKSVMFIKASAIGDSGDEQTQMMCSSGHVHETLEQLQRLRKINEKEYNTICIIGLEKAGKSSFINALLGFELLPYKIERCTQIQTILKPLSKQEPFLFATIEFYSEADFQVLINKMPKEKDETDDAFQRRVALIQQTRKKSIPLNTLIQSKYASNQAEREKITKDLHTFIANALYLNIVKQVIIFTNKLPGQNYELIDVPGCDSPIEEHRLSGVNAVRHADAFLFLTDGQRPSLTNDQVRLLNEIQGGHFDGMKRAFGIITKLDLCQTRAKFVEHQQKTQSELVQRGFLREQIYPVSAHVSLLEETKTDMDQLKKIKEHIAQFESLPNGFDKCKKALNNYIEYELPHSRLRQVVSIAQQKLVRYVQDALNLGRQLIPIDMKQTSLDDYIKQMNTEKWDEIFTNERYEPVLRRAARWQKESLVVNRAECTSELTKYFYEQFQVCTQEIINKNHPIEQIMFERHDIALLQMNPYDIETTEREKITIAMLKAVVQASNELAVHMYDKYVNELEKYLNEICPEQGDLFQDNLTQERCSIEVQTLILRVAHPVVMATIRWPHVYKDNRVEAGKELTRVAPTIAFNVYEDDREKPSSVLSDGASMLAKTIGTVLELYMKKNVPMALAMTLFRRL